MIVSPLRLLTNKTNFGHYSLAITFTQIGIFFDEQCARAGTAAGIQIHP
jgi:hypothetical protein